MTRAILESDDLNITLLRMQTRTCEVLAGIEALGVMFLYNPVTKTVVQDPDPDLERTIETCFYYLSTDEIIKANAAVTAVVSVIRDNWR